MKSRQELNLEILAKLEEIILSNPDLRFGQILEGYGVYKKTSPLTGKLESIYFEEPQETLVRIKE